MIGTALLMGQVMHWTAEAPSFSRCWADRRHPFSGQVDDCGRPTTRRSGLCDRHHVEIIGPLNDEEAGAA